MQMQGDLKKLEKNIEITFQKKLDLMQVDLEKSLDAHKQQVKLQKEQIKDSFTQKLKKETDLAKKKEQSAAVCEARSDFDEKKQVLLESLFGEIAKDAKAVETKEYKQSVSALIKGLSAAENKNATLSVSAKTLVPSSFKGDVKTTKDFIGVKLHSGESVVDLSLSTLLEIKKEQLMVCANEALFE